MDNIIAAKTNLILEATVNHVHCQGHSFKGNSNAMGKCHLDSSWVTRAALGVGASLYGGGVLLKALAQPLGSPHVVKCY